MDPRLAHAKLLSEYFRFIERPKPILVGTKSCSIEGAESALYMY